MLETNTTKMKAKLCRTLSLLVILGINILPVKSQTVFLDIRKWSGDNQKIELKALNKITFSSNDLVLNYFSGTNENIATSLIQNIVFSKATGFKDVNADKSTVLVYPNPSNDFITIKNTPEIEVNITIYSISGIQIMSLQSYSVNEPINISHLNKGIYILKVNNKTLKFTKL